MKARQILAIIPNHQRLPTKDEGSLATFVLSCRPETKGVMNLVSFPTTGLVSKGSDALTLYSVLANR